MNSTRSRLAPKQVGGGDELATTCRMRDKEGDQAMTASDNSGALGEKLDTLIRIQAALAVKDMPSQKEKIVFLYGAGLGPNYIASLLGTTPKTVSVAMAKHKKASVKKGEVADE